MKASTLFGMTTALIAGLVILVGVRYSGFFEVPAPPPEKKVAKLPLVLVANRNLIQGTAALPGDGRLRPLLESEMDFYDKFKSKLLPAMPSAVDYRVLAKHVVAGQMLLEEYFEPQSLPETLSARVKPGMRTVNLSLPHELAAGGLLRVGEYVDVLLTTVISSNPSNSENVIPVSPFTATGVIARNLKIIVKRDSLLTVVTPIPQNRPMSFIIEANPYRAALIEYAKGKGTISITPSVSFMPGKSSFTSTAGDSASDPDSREYRDEDRRIQEFVNNEAIITDTDLERVFNLKLKVRPQPVADPTPQPIKVDLFVGTRLKKSAIEENGKMVYFDPPNPSVPKPPSIPKIEPMSNSAFRFGTLEKSSSGGNSNNVTPSGKGR